MNKFKMFCSSILLFFAGSACAQIPDLLDLLETYQLALESDPSFKVANDQRLANEQAIPTAVAGFLPFVNAQLQQQNLLDDNFFQFEESPVESVLSNFDITIAGTQIIRTYTYSANVTQTLFDLGKWHTIRQSYRIKDQAEATYINAGQDLAFRTAQAYFHVLDTIDNLNYVIAEKEAIEKQLLQTNEKFKVGLLAITDVKELEAQRDAIRAQEISGYNQIQSAKEALRVIIGVLPDNLAALESNIPLSSPAPTDSDTWAGIAEDTNPNLQAAKYYAEVQKQGVNIARDQNFPTLNFNGVTYKERYGTLNDPISPTSEWQWTANLIAQVNIFSGGAMTANLRKAQFNYQQALDNLEKTRRDTIRNAENAYRDVGTALSSVKAYQKSVASNQIAVDATIAGYNVGTRTSVDVLTEISNLYQQQKNLATARYDYILSILALKKAAGILTIQDIAMVNQMLIDKPALIHNEAAEREDIEEFVGEKNPPLHERNLPQ